MGDGLRNSLRRISAAAREFKFVTNEKLTTQRLPYCCAGILLVGMSVAGCGASKSELSNADGMDRVVLMLNWFPEAEHGGFYAAKVHGVFEQHGLDVEIRPGGPSAPVAQELVSGRVQFAIGNADDVLVFRQQDVPVVALMAPIQNTPRCILVHDQSPIQKLTDLAGVTLQAGAGRPYLTFMEKKGLLEGVQVVPYSGVSKFAADTSSAMQAYSFSEPLLARQQGAVVRTLMVSETGFNPYASCLVATEDYLTANQDVARRMVVACREGWRKYFESPGEVNAAILADNQHGMTTEVLQFGTDELRPLCIPDGMTAEDIGGMSHARWQSLFEQFVEIGLIEPTQVNVDSVYTNEFIERAAPQGAAMAE